MPRETKNSWTAPSMQDFNVVSRKRIKPDTDVMDSTAPEPKSVADLVVHPRKISEVRKWLTWCQGERAPILLISGPSGSGKTVTLKLLAHDEGLSVTEWICPVSKNVGPNFLDDTCDKNAFVDLPEGKKFEEFITRSSRYPSLFQPKKRNLILVKDVPNTFIWKPELFHAFLQKYANHGKSPIVFIVTDDENLDLNTSLFPNVLKSRLGITAIKFNPVGDTFLKKNLKILSEKVRGGTIPSECLDRIAKNAVGDLRSATTEVMVQLRTGELTPSTAQTTKRRKRNSATDEDTLNRLPEANPFSYRDHGYDFYKKMGRVLYPKRSGDDSSTSNEPPGQLVHNVLEIADNWTRSNLSFLHENYLQTCSKLEDATVAADCFSFCDVLSRLYELDSLSGIVSVAGLMTANTQPKKNGFLPFKKSVKLDSIKDAKCVFNEASVSRFGVEERVFALDVAPMKQWLPLDVDPSVRTLTCDGVKRNMSQVSNYTSSQTVVNRVDNKDLDDGNDDSSETSSEEYEIEDDDE